MKTWFISTWGAGTPDYLVTAESKERAWSLVAQAWRRSGLGYYVGEVPYVTARQLGRGHQTIGHLKEVKGFYGDEERVINLRDL